MIPYLVGYQHHGEDAQGVRPGLYSALERPTLGKVWAETDVAAIYAGGSYCTLIQTPDGLSQAVGGSEMGQTATGLKSGINRLPIPTLLPPCKQISVNCDHGLALTETGLVEVWGATGHGELVTGIIDKSEADLQADATPHVVDLSKFGTPAGVAAGPEHMLVWFTDGTYVGWALNQNGQLGLGTVKSPVLTPTKGLLDGVVEMACGANWSVARREDGTAWACGRGFFGELGEPIAMSATWVQVRAANAALAAIPVRAVRAAGRRGVAILEDNTPVWWGETAKGTGFPAAPIPGLPKVQDVSLACYENLSLALALDLNGETYGQGANAYCQLGDGTRAYKSHFVPLNFRAHAISAGETHSAFLV